MKLRAAATGARRDARPARVSAAREPHLSIDPAQLRRAGFMPEAGMEGQIAACFQQIKRPLLARAAAASGPDAAALRVIMVSSALPGDGKTFTCINLALSIARERDLSVLLVDADVARPRASAAYGVAAAAGIMEALQDESVDVDALVLTTSVPGLSILPAGQPMENAAEMLASGRMQEIVRRLLSSDSQRIVVLDSPPLLVSAAARILTGYAGQVVLVARSLVTPRQAMLDALELVGAEKCTGLVLNDSRAASSTGRYGYGEYGDSAVTGERNP